MARHAVVKHCLKQGLAPLRRPRGEARRRLVVHFGGVNLQVPAEVVEVFVLEGTDEIQGARRVVPQADDEVGRVGKTEIQLQGHGLAFFADGLEAQVEDDDRDGDDEDVEGAPVISSGPGRRRCRRRT